MRSHSRRGQRCAAPARPKSSQEPADAVFAGVVAVDRALTELLGVTGLEQLRAGLVALCDIRDRLESEQLPGIGQAAR